jgi:extracellular factor (EF) 3-hydroxypalmitic acid methyl ester biosynthesis protein
MNIFYEMLEPGGLLVATNVDSTNPNRQTMENLLEWHLIYRSHQQFESLRPEAAPDAECGIRADPTGCNLFFEIRKPVHA